MSAKPTNQRHPKRRPCPAIHLGMSTMPPATLDHQNGPAQILKLGWRLVQSDGQGKPCRWWAAYTDKLAQLGD
jgi:hypothetical protein